MNFENIPQKQLNEIEHRVRDLLISLRKAKLHHEPLAESLRQLEQELGKARRERFDSVNSEYRTY